MSQVPTTNQSIYKWSIETPENIAIINRQGERLTYANLAIYIAKFIKAFESAGVKKYMHVGIHLESHQRVIDLILTYSLEALGVIRVTQLSDAEIVKHCDIIFSTSQFSISENNPVFISINQEWIDSTNRISLSAGDLQRLNYQPLASDLIFFNSTSGTTGQKKYFFETHNAMHHQFALMKEVYFKAQINNFLCLYEVTIGLAYVGCSLALRKGGAIIFTTSDLFISDMQNYGNSHSAMLLREASYFQRSLSERVLGNKLSTLRILGAHLPIRTRTWLENNLSQEVFNSYSSNESGQICEMQSNGQGVIYPGIGVKVVNDNCEELALGGVGRIAIKSPMQISSYLWNDDLNSKYFKDGWFYSNDIGYMPQVGKLIVVDRLDNMLNLGGIKVPPIPIEDSIRQINGVEDCILFSDNSFFDFETLLVCIEPTHGSDENALNIFIKKVLADSFKSIHINYYDKFPRTESGKVQRNELKRKVFEALSRGKEGISTSEVTTLLQQGFSLHQLGELNEAKVVYEQILEIRADHFDALQLLGLVSAQSKQYARAVYFLNRALKSNPNYAACHSNLGVALHELGLVNEAIASYDKAISIKPDYAEAYCNRGLALKALGYPNESLASFDNAISMNPDYAEAYSSRGDILQGLGRLDEALLSYEKAIGIKPDYAQAHWNLSLGHLLVGNFKSGWQGYEWRSKNEDINRTIGIRGFEKPLWLGVEAVKDQTILLYAEQGLGDTIQFCRYVPLVAKLGAKVILEVQRPLLKLLKNLDGVSDIFTKDDNLPEFNYQCPLMSLPSVFKTELDSIPVLSRYISHEPDKLENWQIKLGKKNRQRVGIVWSGGVTHISDQYRSLTLSQLLPYLPPCFEYFSLQKEVRDIDKDLLAQHSEIKYFGDELEDFSDTAALCEFMDVIISVDTSVAHLAGALGRPTWILIPFSPDWRWLLDRDDSPWYPSVKLYRQEKINNWESVLERVRADLLAMP